MKRSDNWISWEKIFSTCEAYASTKWDRIRCSEALILASCEDKNKKFESVPTRMSPPPTKFNEGKMFVSNIFTSPISMSIRLMKYEQSFINLQSRFGDFILMQTNYALCIWFKLGLRTNDPCTRCLRRTFKTGGIKMSCPFKYINEF